MQLTHLLGSWVCHAWGLAHWWGSSSACLLARPVAWVLNTGPTFSVTSWLGRGSLCLPVSVLKTDAWRCFVKTYIYQKKRKYLHLNILQLIEIIKMNKSYYIHLLVTTSFLLPFNCNLFCILYTDFFFLVSWNHRLSLTYLIQINYISSSSPCLPLFWCLGDHDFTGGNRFKPVPLSLEYYT